MLLENSQCLCTFENMRSAERSDASMTVLLSCSCGHHFQRGGKCVSASYRGGQHTCCSCSIRSSSAALCVHCKRPCCAAKAGHVSWQAVELRAGQEARIDIEGAEPGYTFIFSPQATAGEIHGRLWPCLRFVSHEHQCALCEATNRPACSVYIYCACATVLPIYHYSARIRVQEGMTKVQMRGQAGRGPGCQRGPSCRKQLCPLAQRWQQMMEPLQLARRLPSPS